MRPQLREEWNPAQGVQRLSELWGIRMEIFESYLPASQGLESVEREVACFFREHPFLLVSEGRLATLLCRPREMVTEAVLKMERAGKIVRRDRDTLLGVNDELAGIENPA